MAEQRTAEAIAQDLRDLRPRKAELETRWKALKTEFLQALGSRASAGGVRLLAKRHFVFRPSVVPYLIEVLNEEERARVFRPVAEELEKLYADGRLTLTGMFPHIEKVEVSQNLDFPDDRKKPERKMPSKAEFMKDLREMGA